MLSNMGYEGNTAFFYGDEYKVDKFYVERVYYDSPREDCSGYYSNVYEFDTAKEAYKSAMRWCRSDEPEGAYVDLRSGKPRVYKLINSDGEVFFKTTDYEEFEEKRTLWLEMYCKLKLPKLRLKIAIV